MTPKMWQLIIRFKRNDQVGDKRLETLLIDLLRQSGVSGATAWTGVDGFGKRGKSTLRLEGVTINMPLLIEVIDTKDKLEPLLPEIKKLVDDDGVVTVGEVAVI